MIPTRSDFATLTKQKDRFKCGVVQSTTSQVLRISARTQQTACTCLAHIHRHSNAVLFAFPRWICCLHVTRVISQVSTSKGRVTLYSLTCCTSTRDWCQAPSVVGCRKKCARTVEFGPDDGPVHPRKPNVGYPVDGHTRQCSHECRLRFNFASGRPCHLSSVVWNAISQIRDSRQHKYRAP